MLAFDSIYIYITIGIINCVKIQSDSQTINTQPLLSIYLYSVFQSII